MNIYYRGADNKLHQFEADTDDHRLAINRVKQWLKSLSASEKGLRPAGPVLAVIDGGANDALQA